MFVSQVRSVGPQRGIFRTKYDGPVCLFHCIWKHSRVRACVCVCPICFTRMSIMAKCVLWFASWEQSCSASCQSFSPRGAKHLTLRSAGMKESIRQKWMGLDGSAVHQVQFQSGPDANLVAFIMRCGQSQGFLTSRRLGSVMYRDGAGGCWWVVVENIPGWEWNQQPVSSSYLAWSRVCSIYQGLRQGD